MTEFPIRYFDSDEAVARVGDGLMSRTLPRSEWTHEAHIAATAYLLLKHPEIDLDAELPDLIRRYNESVGGVNSDSEGYHDTITRAYLHGVRLFLSEAEASAPIHELVKELLHSPMGRRDWPLRFWSRDRLFSVEARREFVPPRFGGHAVYRNGAFIRLATGDANANASNASGTIFGGPYASCPCLACIDAYRAFDRTARWRIRRSSECGP